MATRGPYTLPDQPFSNGDTFYSPGIPVFGAVGVVLAFDNNAGDVGEVISSIDVLLDPNVTALAETGAQATALLASSSLTSSVLTGFLDVEAANIDLAKAGYVQFAQSVGGVYVPVRSIWQWMYLKVAKSVGADICNLRVKAYVEYPGDMPHIANATDDLAGDWV